MEIYLLLANEIRIINRTAHYKIPSAYDDKSTKKNMNKYIGVLEIRDACLGLYNHKTQLLWTWHDDNL
jgi:hypothetical protein